MTITGCSAQVQEPHNTVPFPTRVIYSSPFPEKEKDKQAEYNNYYYIRAREHTEKGVNVVEIAEMYQDVMGRPMPRFVEHEVLAMLDAGIQADMICAVLAYTGGAPRPSWVYARTVLEKQAAMGARTAAEFHGNVSKWRSSRAAGGKRVQEQQYQQRPADPQLDDVPEDQLAEMRRQNHDR